MWCLLEGGEIEGGSRCAFAGCRDERDQKLR